MATAIRFLALALVWGVITILAACGSDEDPTTNDPFADFFRPGLYTRDEGDKTYEVWLGGSGQYSLKVDGADHRVGSYTLVGTSFSPKDLNKAFAFIDEDGAAVQCAEDEEPGAYIWKFTETSMSLDVFDEPCDQRKDELESDDWQRLPDPSPTPAPTLTS